MKMYRTWYNDLIETVEVVRVTENSVYLPAIPAAAILAAYIAAKKAMQ